MSVRLMNDATEARVRSSEGCNVLPCGCAHSDVAWLQLCDAHWQDWHMLHTRARPAHCQDTRPGQETS